MEKQQITKIGYSVEEVSKMTTLSTSFLRNEIRKGKLKARNVSRRVLILVKDLENYLEETAVWKPKAER